MAKQVIAKIKLAPGECGYYDEYSRVYLTIASPVACVYSDTNCTQIKQSIKSGRLKLIEGSFSAPIEEKKILEPKIKAVKKEEIKPVEAIAEDVVTESLEPSEAEVPVEEEAKPRRRKKKKEAEVIAEEMQETVLPEVTEEASIIIEE